MAKDDIELVLDAHAQIGESLIWSVAEQALYWIDVKAPAFYRLNPATGATRTWPLPDEIGCYALYANEQAALLALRSGLFRLDLANDALTKLADPPYNPLRYRFNEGGCDGKGRFWAGIMYDPKEEAGDPEPGPLYSYTKATGLVTHPDRALITNGLAWSKDGRAMFLSHSKDHTIYQYDFDAEQGQISNRRVFAQLPSSMGMPDGAALDEEGCYWSAIHGGSRLIRFKPDGRVDREVKLPVSQPTMCAFAGPNLDVLYVTSAASGLGVVHKVTEPHAGGLFRFRPGVRGLPTNNFAG